MEMKRYIEPKPETWDQIVKRASQDNMVVERRVSQILERVKKDGDRALYELTKEIDNVSLKSFLLEQSVIDSSAKQVSPQLVEAIEIAYSNIEKFHKAQFPQDIEVETMSGVKCMIKSFPIEKVGLYIPGGTAPLFSTVLMLGIPALIAKCKDVIMFTPPLPTGGLDPTIAYAAKRVGISKIVTVGGAQAIAAMAYGTEVVDKRDKIFGPGNSYVAAAKQQVSSNVAIDMVAGPSELMVIATSECNPTFVAADLLSQAEHGPDSQVFLITNNVEIIERVSIELEKQLAKLPRNSIAQKALENSSIIVFKDFADIVNFANIYAPEHLIVATNNPWEIASKIRNAGSVFIGNYSPESAGDYASGTNHTLPTAGWAKSTGGITLDSFMHKVSFQELTSEGLLNLSSTITTMAIEEKLDAHANAVLVRVNGDDFI